MINKFSLILFGTLLSWSFPNLSDASYSSPADTHTHTSTIELKPASLKDSYQTASVCFLGVGDCSSGDFTKGNEDYQVDTARQCMNEGYVKLNCNSVQQINKICPYNSSYGKNCVCLSNLITCPSGQVGVGDSCGGKYLSCQCSPSLVSCASNQNGQGASCGGKYQSCSCKPEYQYNSSNCTSPRSVSGSYCGGKYTGCSCPSGVSQGLFGCKEYYPAPCGSVCRIAKSDNCSNRTSVSTPYGCMNYFADCSSKCERAYPDNCRNRTAVTAANGCQTYWADCSTKCQVAYGDNCRNRTAVSTPYGCRTYWSDCSSKCQVAYSDNCRNRTAVSAPNGCSKYFSDCPSKCEIANLDTALICSNKGYSTSYYCTSSEGMTTEKCPENSLYGKCVFSCNTYKNYIESTLASNMQMAQNSYANACGKWCNTKPVWPKEFCKSAQTSLQNKANDYKAKCGSTIHVFFTCPITECKDGMHGIELCSSNMIR